LVRAHPKYGRWRREVRCQVKLQVGKAVEYVVALSSYEPVVGLRYVGKILCCVEKYGDVPMMSLQQRIHPPGLTRSGNEGQRQPERRKANLTYYPVWLTGPVQTEGRQSPSCGSTNAIKSRIWHGFLR